MKVGDLVKYDSNPAWSNQAYTVIGMIIAKSLTDGMLTDTFEVLWSDGEFVERVPQRILKVIND